MIRSAAAIEAGDERLPPPTFQTIAEEDDEGDENPELGFEKHGCPLAGARWSRAASTAARSGARPVRRSTMAAAVSAAMPRTLLMASAVRAAMGVSETCELRVKLGLEGLAAGVGLGVERRAGLLRDGLRLGPRVGERLLVGRRGRLRLGPQPMRLLEVARRAAPSGPGGWPRSAAAPPGTSARRAGPKVRANQSSCAREALALEGREAPRRALARGRRGAGHGLGHG